MDKNKLVPLNVINNSFLLNVMCALIIFPLVESGHAQEPTITVDSIEKSNLMLEEVVVTGIRATQQKNLTMKRFADSVVDTITAEDIGKLPDVTIADSLQRVPGIQIRRSAGEGSTINIRGMPEVTTLLNGEQFLSAGSITTVQPDFTDIASALISGLDVLKSPKADTLAGGVSGTINLNTYRPLQLHKGFTFTSAGEASSGSYSKKDDGKYTAFVGYNSGKFGAIFTVSYDKANLANYRYGAPHEGWAMAYGEGTNCSWPCATGLVDVNGDGDFNDTMFGFIDYGMMNRFSERERLGISGTFQGKLSESIELVGDVFFTTLDDADRTQGLTADNSWNDYGWITPQNPVDRGPSAYGGSFLTSQVVTLNTQRISAFSESQTNDRESLNINFQIMYDNDGPLKGSVRIIHGEAERAHTENVAGGLLTSGEQHALMRRDENGLEPVNPRGYGPDRIPITYDITGENPHLAFPRNFGQDISQYNMVSTYSENNFDEDASLDVFRLDANYTFELVDLSSVDFGVRYGNRDVERATWVMVAPFTSGGVTKDVMWKDSGNAIADTNGDGQINVADGDLTIGHPLYFDSLPSSWVIQTSDFGPLSSVGSAYFIDPKKLDDLWAFQNALYPGNKKLGDPSRSYKVTEETQTFYTKANFSGDHYHANIGFQYIKTELDILQNELGVSECAVCPGGLNDIGDLQTKRAYTDILPSMNIAINLTDSIIFRAAYGKTMTRLDLDRLADGLSVTRVRAADLGVEVEGVSSELKVAVEGSLRGNPLLEPWRSTNTDLSLEWYVNQSSMLSLALFNIDIESFIEDGQQMMGLPDEDGVIRRQVVVSTEVNGQGGSIDGVELAYQQAFDFLPGIWNGFGVSLNYTYAPSESGNVDFEGEVLPIADNSERSGNAVIWYEKDQFQFRVAANYRSTRLSRNSNVWGLPNGLSTLPIWTAPTTYVDLSASYDITDNISIYTGVTNVTEEYENNYLQWKDNTISQNIYERRVILGFRARL